MMTVGSARRKYNHDHQSTSTSRGGLTDKQVTPFSIDDILSESKKMNFKSAEKMFASTALNSIFPSRLLCDFPKNLMPGHPSLYSNWLERLQTLCVASSLHPLWFSSCCSDVKLPNAFYNRLHASSNLPNNSNLQQHNNTTLHTSLPTSERHIQREFRKRKHSNTSLTSQNYDECTLTSARQSNERKFINGGTVSDRSPESCGKPARDRDETKKRPNSDSPLSALEKLTCSTFKNMEAKQNILHAIATGQETKVKRRKCRTAFSTFQLSVLEQRFSCHKYLTPTDRDQIAHLLGLSAPQVITWFQNRRAKQKRDLEEMKNDIKTVKKWTDKDCESVDSSKECSTLEDLENDEIDVESC